MYQYIVHCSTAFLFCHSPQNFNCEVFGHSDLDKLYMYEGPHGTLIGPQRLYIVVEIVVFTCLSDLDLSVLFYCSVVRGSRAVTGLYLDFEDCRLDG